MTQAIDQIIFYNGFKSGDLHVSRGIVKQIVKGLRKQYKFKYLHNCNQEILKDLDIEQDALPKNIDRKGSSFVRDDSLYINTWYGANKLQYIYKFGVSFLCLYHILSDALNYFLDIDISGFCDKISDFYPAIDFDRYRIKNINKYIKSNRKKIMISNGRVLSGQAPNFQFEPHIESIASNNSDIDFILTNKNKRIINLSNVLYSSDIIGKSGCDLNENAYLGTFCDAIVGRFSGVYTFCMNQDNLFNRHVIFLCFLTDDRYNIRHHWLTDEKPNEISYMSHMMLCSKFDKKSITSSISEVVKKVK